MTDPFLSGTERVFDLLAEKGVQRRDTIGEWLAGDADLIEWLEWAQENDLVVQLHGAGVTDPSGRWALSPELAKVRAAKARLQRS
jgi:hypothetical protein